jgi:hypothetical protein
MAISRTSRSRHRVGGLVALAVAAVLLGACSVASGASAQLAPASTATSATSAPTSAGGISPQVGAPTIVTVGGGSAVAASAAVSSGPAIAYPYPGYPGNPRVAADHTIVVTGFGQALVQADLSDRAAAQQAALKAALADAKAQADTVASTTGVTISGVLSVSVSSSQGYGGPLPMVVGGAASGSGSAAPGVPTPVQPPVAGPEFDVTVTVAYRIG